MVCPNYPRQHTGRNTHRLSTIALRAFSACAIALGLAACGNTPAIESLSVSPSAVALDQVTTSGSTLHTLDADRCPSTPVAGFNADDVHESTVTFGWRRTNTPDVQIEIERRNVTNVYVSAGSFVVNDNATSQEWHTRSGGVYRARIRTRSCGDQYGPWSDWISFGVDDAIETDGSAGPGASASGGGGGNAAVNGNNAGGNGGNGNNAGGNGNGNGGNGNNAGGNGNGNGGNGNNAGGNGNGNGGNAGGG